MRTRRLSQPRLPTIADASERSEKRVSFTEEPDSRKRRTHSLPLVLSRKELELLDDPRPASSSINSCNGSIAHLLALSSEIPVHATQDYDAFEPFTKRDDGSYPSDTKCLLCKCRPITTVFFPCQHMCVCSKCIRMYSIGAKDESKFAATWNSCPVCLTTIQLMLPHNGGEDELYWKWITSVEPILPTFYSHADAAQPRRRSMNEPITPTEKRPSAPTSPRKGRLSHQNPDALLRAASDSKLNRHASLPKEPTRRPSSVCIIL